MLKTRHVLLAKVETSYNSEASPTAGSNAILVENLQWSFEGARRAERNALTTKFAPLKSLYAGSLIGLSFDVEIKGSGSAGTAPELAPLLLGCGMSETVVAATSVAYAPDNDPSNHESLTMYLYEDGIRYKITGARGSFSMSLQTAQAGKLSFKFVGHLLPNTADTALASPTLSSVVPPVIKSVVFEVDSYEAIVSKLEVDPGITVATPDNMASDDGYGEIRITAMAPTFSIDPEATVLATYNWLTKWQSSASYLMQTGVIGTSAGNRYKFEAPAAVYTELGTGDRDGILTREIKGMLTDTSGAAFMTLTFT